MKTMIKRNKAIRNILDESIQDQHRQYTRKFMLRNLLIIVSIVVLGIIRIFLIAFGRLRFESYAPTLSSPYSFRLYGRRGCLMEISKVCVCTLVITMMGAPFATLAQDVTVDNLRVLQNTRVDGRLRVEKNLRTNKNVRIERNLIVKGISFSGVFDTVADMLNFSPEEIHDGTAVRVLGRETVNDGGGGLFFWSEFSGATVDGGINFAPVDAPLDSAGNLVAGRWKRVVEDTINVRWFGAKGGVGSDDTVAIQAAMDAAGGNFHRILFGVPNRENVFRITSTLTIPPVHNGLILDGGSGVFKTYLLWDGAPGGTMLRVGPDPLVEGETGFGGIQVKGLSFQNGSAFPGTCIRLTGGNTQRFSDLYFKNCENYAIHLGFSDGATLATEPGVNTLQMGAFERLNISVTENVLLPNAIGIFLNHSASEAITFTDVIIGAAEINGMKHAIVKLKGTVAFYALQTVVKNTSNYSIKTGGSISITDWASEDFMPIEWIPTGHSRGNILSHVSLRSVNPMPGQYAIRWHAACDVTLDPNCHPTGTLILDGVVIFPWSQTGDSNHMGQPADVYMNSPFVANVTFRDNGTGFVGDIKPTSNGRGYGLIQRLQGEPIFQSWNISGGISVGQGSPQNSLMAPVGAIYVDTDGGTETLWVKQSGGNGSSGWVAK